MTGYYPQQIRMEPKGRFRLDPHVAAIPRRWVTVAITRKWHVNGAPCRRRRGIRSLVYLGDHDRHFFPQRHLKTTNRFQRWRATAALHHDRRRGPCDSLPQRTCEKARPAALLPIRRVHGAAFSAARCRRTSRATATDIAGVGISFATSASKPRKVGPRSARCPPESQIIAPSGQPDTLQKLGSAEILTAILGLN